ncbi:hypothetical protein [Microbacterium sp. 77mftsu3.1]|uniref:hypothetical protein n=1 Tax=Microbacterium sp. 77mftsu3.1 TaxID=1761802 RepID=UPI00036B243C|nr:hypothetical protein [Microbacterium sp. 77mftsu3.1]
MTADDRILIGHVCEKDDHLDLIGDGDYGVCSSHHYASIYVSVTEDRPSMRGGTFTAADAASGIEQLVERLDRLSLTDPWEHIASAEDAEKLWVGCVLRTDEGSVYLRSESGWLEAGFVGEKATSDIAFPATLIAR